MEDVSIIVLALETLTDVNAIVDTDYAVMESVVKVHISSVIHFTRAVTIIILACSNNIRIHLIVILTH